MTGQANTSGPSNTGRQANTQASAGGGGSRPDPFGTVLGAGRGLNDATAGQERLRASEERLTQTAAKLAAAEERERVLRDRVDELDREVGRLVDECNELDRSARHAQAVELELVVERDRARYAAMRSGQRDPAPARTWERVHHGVWTPGRPYLSYQHVWHPKTGDCYQADKGGAPAGEMPGTGRHWQACMDTPTCPTPLPVLAGELEHPLGGPALRQTELWWDVNHTAWTVREIADDYLENIIAFLRRHARQMCAAEAEQSIPFVPCPWNAYPSAAAWLADTPLMRALLRERRRRQDGARRRAGGSGEQARS